jgi:hypothetical protein
MNPYRGSRPLWAPSSNLKGLNHDQLDALERWFATREMPCSSSQAPQLIASSSNPKRTHTDG